jgi:hypothetical protein
MIRRPGRSRGGYGCVRSEPSRALVRGQKTARCEYFPSGALRLQAILENLYNVATTVKYRNDLQRVGLGPVDNQVGVHTGKNFTSCSVRLLRRCSVSGEEARKTNFSRMTLST